ncbi:MAG TPA: hypothetical protein VNX22_04685 [Acidobacteriaceae bacterium]|nr:hypothetical protein [Acidobacteriaceae bacterium]
MRRVVYKPDGAAIRAQQISRQIGIQAQQSIRILFATDLRRVVKNDPRDALGILIAVRVDVLGFGSRPQSSHPIPACVRHFSENTGS